MGKEYKNSSYDINVSRDRGKFLEQWFLSYKFISNGYQGSFSGGKTAGA
jgi:hypothetical protein